MLFFSYILFHNIEFLKYLIHKNLFKQRDINFSNLLSISNKYNEGFETRLCQLHLFFLIQFICIGCHAYLSIEYMWIKAPFKVHQIRWEKEKLNHKTWNVNKRQIKSRYVIHIGLAMTNCITIYIFLFKSTSSSSFIMVTMSLLTFKDRNLHCIEFRTLKKNLEKLTKKF